MLAACKARAAQKLDAAQEENLRKQGAVSGQRAKKRDAAGQGASGDADLEVQAISGVEMEQVVEFPIGKLGMDIANNGIVCKVGSVEDGSAAGELGVGFGWFRVWFRVCLQSGDRGGRKCGGRVGGRGFWREVGGGRNYVSYGKKNSVFSTPRNLFRVVRGRPQSPYDLSFLRRTSRFPLEQT